MTAKPGKSNIALLTEGQSYIQRAKKQRRDQIEEIKFDDTARQEWLSGFHKRKKARTEEKRVRARERDRLAHNDERKKARDELKERAAQNVKDMRRAMGLPDIEDANEDQSGAGSSLAREEQEAEYSDEDNIATVTITDDFDPSDPTPSTSRSIARSSSSPQPNSRSVIPSLMPVSSHKAQKRAKKLNNKRKAEKEVSRSMETKAERKKGRDVEARRRHKKAAVALARDGRRQVGNLHRRSNGSRGKGLAKKGGKR